MKGRELKPTLLSKMRYFLLLLAAAVPSLFAAPLPPKADLLAENTVVAQLVGVKDRPCHFRTALCPDRCGHATRVALFRVEKNEHYAKHGQYGDAKVQSGEMLMVDLLGDVAGQPDEVKKLLSELKPGDVVRLTQKHYYADFGHVMEPVRPVTAVEKVGEKNLPSPSPKHPADHDDEVMPIRSPR